MTTSPRPLRDDEIAEYVPRLTTAYAAELREHLYLDAEAAAAKAERSAADAFPGGAVGKGHWLPRRGGRRGHAGRCPVARRAVRRRGRKPVGVRHRDR